MEMTKKKRMKKVEKMMMGKMVRTASRKKPLVRKKRGKQEKKGGY